jgi:hypothetical protein
MGLLTYLKKNRIKILKILITIVVIYFIFSVILQITSTLFDDIYNIITLTYILILILCNFIVEFSPYILNNYLIFIFPFLSHYSGRGAIYILIGFATISPELIKWLNFGGYALIIIGLLCLYMNWLIVKNFKLEYQDFEVMKDNYQDFNDESQKDSLTFPKFITNYDNNSSRNSTNNDYNYNNDKIKNDYKENKIEINENEENNNENIENNILKLKDVYNNNENSKKENNIEMGEIKD